MAILAMEHRESAGDENREHGEETQPPRKERRGNRDSGSRGIECLSLVCHSNRQATIAPSAPMGKATRAPKQSRPSASDIEETRKPSEIHIADCSATADDTMAVPNAQPTKTAPFRMVPLSCIWGEYGAQQALAEPRNGPNRARKTSLDGSSSRTRHSSQAAGGRCSTAKAAWRPHSCRSGSRSRPRAGTARECARGRPRPKRA